METILVLKYLKCLLTSGTFSLEAHITKSVINELHWWIQPFIQNHLRATEFAADLGHMYEKMLQWLINLISWKRQITFWRYSVTHISHVMYWLALLLWIWVAMLPTKTKNYDCSSFVHLWIHPCVHSKWKCSTENQGFFFLLLLLFCFFFWKAATLVRFSVGEYPLLYCLVKSKHLII